MQYLLGPKTMTESALRYLVIKTHSLNTMAMNNYNPIICILKLGLFGHVCWTKNNRKIKSVMLGTVEGTGNNGGHSKKWETLLCTEWLDDIEHN